MAEGIITRRGGGGAQFIEATGGTVTEITEGGLSYRVHTFTDVGTSTFEITKEANLENANKVEYLVIAGGGNGRRSGGGAGGYRSSVVGELSGQNSAAESRLTVIAKVYNVTVGGAESNSSFDIIETIAGGTGVGFNTPGNPGGSGSGGGGANPGRPGGAGTAGQGFQGGNGARRDFVDPCGGGGGAGQSGGNASFGASGRGGDGLESKIDGVLTFRAGGGGGTNAFNNSSSSNGAGGLGGGGNGDLSNGQPGASNTGGGGGGGSGAGGSGIVIIRYPIGFA